MEDDQRSLYQASKWEIFSRNFLVGVSRALGALIMQIIGLAVLYFLFTQFVSPTITPVLNSFQDAINVLKRFQSPNSNQGFFFRQESSESTTAPTTR